MSVVIHKSILLCCIFLGLLYMRPAWHVVASGSEEPDGARVLDWESQAAPIEFQQLPSSTGIEQDSELSELNLDSKQQG